MDSSIQDFRYSYDSDKPHAVTEVTPSTNFPNAISADSCETDYNVFNQPSRIAEGDVEILLEYGADNQRVKVVFKNRGRVERTRYYISSNYEKEIDSRGEVYHYHYIYGATGLAAICVRRNGVDSMYYVHPDRLGSYTHITDSSRRVICSLHFDPWGNVKTDTDWRTFDSTMLSGNLAGTFRFSRGFTGHEHYADPYSLTETRFMEGYAEIFAENAETDAETANYAEFHALKLALREVNDGIVGANNHSPLQTDGHINWYALTPAQIAQLQTIAERNTGRASVMAKGVLCFFHGICYEDEWDNVGAFDTPQQGGTATLTMKSIPAGVYVLRVTDAGGRKYHRKIVRK